MWALKKKINVKLQKKEALNQVKSLILFPYLNNCRSHGIITNVYICNKSEPVFKNIEFAKNINVCNSWK